MQETQQILLVEDDRIDVMSVQRALKELKVTNPLVHAENGEVALGFLRDSANSRPGLILLDLNMPRMGGLEFLKIIKDDAILKRIPVVVLTTSNEDQDRLEGYNLGIAGYMLKPVDYKQFVEVIRTIELYWTLSEMPPDS